MLRYKARANADACPTTDNSDLKVVGLWSAEDDSRLKLKESIAKAVISCKATHLGGLGIASPSSSPSVHNVGRPSVANESEGPTGRTPTPTPESPLCGVNVFQFPEDLNRAEVEAGRVQAASPSPRGETMEKEGQHAQSPPGQALLMSPSDIFK